MVDPLIAVVVTGGGILITNILSQWRWSVKQNALRAEVIRKNLEHEMTAEKRLLRYEKLIEANAMQISRNVDVLAKLPCASDPNYTHAKANQEFVLAGVVSGIKEMKDDIKVIKTNHQTIMVRLSRVNGK